MTERETPMQYVKITKPPREDIPAPQYCKVLQDLNGDIVTNCYSTKAKAIILTLVRSGFYEILS